MRIAAVVAELAVVSTLALAGLHKIPGRRRFAASLMGLGLMGLGMPRRRAGAAAVAVIAAELAAAAGLPFLPGPLQAAVTVAAGAVFAGAGLVALRRHLHLPCACFGSLAGPSELGRRQLVLLPVWLVAALVLALGGRSPGSVETGLERVALALLVAAVVSLVPVATEARRARQDRLALQGVLSAVTGAGSLARSGAAG